MVQAIFSSLPTVKLVPLSLVLSTSFHAARVIYFTLLSKPFDGFTLVLGQDELYKGLPWLLYLSWSIRTQAKAKHFLGF